MGLRVLVVNGRGELVDNVKQTLHTLGHEVLSEEADLATIGRATVRTRPDLAITILQEGSQRALAMIRRIVREAACPVIALLDVQDRDFINQAAAEGIFAYLTSGQDEAELQSSIDIVLRRFAEYHSLEGAFSRRAVTERAKGILMERHGVTEEQAFTLLRDEARRSQRKVVDVAESIVGSHGLLPKDPKKRSDA